MLYGRGSDKVTGKGKKGMEDGGKEDGVKEDGGKEDGPIKW